MVYVARNKKEFERVCNLLCELNIEWLNKANCGWNIEIEKPSHKVMLDACKMAMAWFDKHTNDEPVWEEQPSADMATLLQDAIASAEKQA